METRLYQTISPDLQRSMPRESIWKKFISWCEYQEQYRFGWLAAVVAGHGCIITPCILLVVTMTGNNFMLWPLVILAMAAPLVVNLAAMPTKITIPVFFASLLIDLVVLFISVSQLIR
jgi:hypothetical protein